VTVNYQSIGSGGGIKQIQSNTVDFGASDMPLKPDDLEKDGLTQFPTVIGGDVPVINVKGIKPGELKLTGAVLADIFLGKITKWNDPVIAGLNRGMALPDQGISVVHRADGSGTTFIRNGRARPERALRSPGRWGLAARATKASRPTCNASTAP
jgi:phosphate transport system substrate-binding protein